MESKVYIGCSSIHGKGVFAAVDIKKGERILEIDDSCVVTKDNPLQPEKGEYEYHCDYLENGKVVLMQEPERYINHCCDPNVYVKQIEEIRYVYTMRDIKAGEEITFDYCIDGYGDTIWQCNCGSPKCRKTIHSNFFHLSKEKQLDYLPYLARWFIKENMEKVEELRSRRSR
ncbi:MAG: SET domain-containing protein [Candidatus Hodarchaeota archaeon]